MRRAPIVIASTAAGLILVLGYNPRSSSVAGARTPTSLTLGTTAAPATDTPISSTDTSRASAPDTSGSAPTGTSAASAPARRAPATAARAASGSTETIAESGRQFGQIQVKATVSGGKLTKVEIVQLAPYDGRSQGIDDYAVPQLQQQSLDAGSARIDGVSGATYTSQAYATSLQSALDQLKV